MIEPSWATWLTGSPPARISSMNRGFPNESLGGFTEGHSRDDDLAMPAIGSKPTSSRGTTRTLETRGTDRLPLLDGPVKTTVRPSGGTSCLRTPPRRAGIVIQD